MIYRDTTVQIDRPAFVAVINDIWGDYNVYTFVAMLLELSDLQIAYQNAYYRFMTVNEYMALPLKEWG